MFQLIILLLVSLIFNVIALPLSSSSGGQYSQSSFSSSSLPPSPVRYNYSGFSLSPRLDIWMIFSGWTVSSDPARPDLIYYVNIDDTSGNRTRVIDVFNFTSGSLIDRVNFTADAARFNMTQWWGPYVVEAVTNYSMVLMDFVGPNCIVVSIDPITFRWLSVWTLSIPFDNWAHDGVNNCLLVMQRINNSSNQLTLFSLTNGSIIATSLLEHSPFGRFDGYLGPVYDSHSGNYFLRYLPNNKNIEINCRDLSIVSYPITNSASAANTSMFAVDQYRNFLFASNGQGLCVSYSSGEYNCINTPFESASGMYVMQTVDKKILLWTNGWPANKPAFLIYSQLMQPVTQSSSSSSSVFVNSCSTGSAPSSTNDDSGMSVVVIILVVIIILLVVFIVVAGVFLYYRQRKSFGVSSSRRSDRLLEDEMTDSSSAIPSGNHHSSVF